MKIYKMMLITQYIWMMLVLSDLTYSVPYSEIATGVCLLFFGMTYSRYIKTEFVMTIIFVNIFGKDD